MIKDLEGALLAWPERRDMFDSRRLPFASQQSNGFALQAATRGR